jgi:hypothetical protein
MASPVPPASNVGIAPGTRQRSNWLALTSFLLSLAAIVAWVLVLAAEYVLNKVLSVDQAIQYEDTVQAAFWTIYDASHVVFIGAIITGILALVLAKRYARERPWKGFAIAGLVLGIVAITPLLLFDAVLAYFGYACQNGC